MSEKRTPTGSPKRLFILGAGFSKALSPHMPLMAEMNEWAKGLELVPGVPLVGDHFGGDVEALLTFLSQEMPWKSADERHLDLARFHRISEGIAAFIRDREQAAWKDRRPEWAGPLARYWHEAQSTVVTLNYDTLVERLFGEITASWAPGRVEPISLSSLYRLPIASLPTRTGWVFASGDVPTCRLLKLHGSTNWFSADDSAMVARQVYYEYLDPAMAEAGAVDKSDLVPLIIPPVADKSAFYRTSLVRAMWIAFREAYEDADEIICIGYSLPATDLTMRLFLQSVASGLPKRVRVVNSADADRLRPSYGEVFRGCKVDYDLTGHPDVAGSLLDCLAESGSTDVESGVPS